jgi:hypothetical protein
MKPWQQFRRALKISGAGLMSIGLALLATHPIPGAIIGIIGAYGAGLAKDLPRDPWSQGELEAFRAKRTRRSTRPNPLMRLLSHLRTAPLPVTPSRDEGRRG